MRIGVLSVLLAIGSISALADMQQANQAMASKNYIGAVEAYQGVLAQDPNNAPAMKQLGTAYYYGGDKAKALAWYNAYLEIQPGDASTKRFADALRAQGVTAAPVSQPGPVAASGADHGSGFGIRGVLGYAGGLSGWSYGSNVASGGSYTLSPGSGLNYGIECLYALNGSLEFGLGASPVSIDAKDSSNYSNTTAKTTTKDDSTAKFSSLPLILTTYLKHPVSKSFTLLAGLGIGYATGGDFTVVSTDASTFNGSSSGGSTSTDTTSLDGTFVYRGVLGTEYSFTRSFSIFGALGALVADFSPSKEVSSSTTTNSTGAVTFSSTSTTTYQAGAPAKSSSPTNTATAFPPSGTGTYTTTSDDGVTKNTTTYTYVGFSPTKIESVSTSIRQKTSSYDVQPLSLQIGCTFRF